MTDNKDKINCPACGKEMVKIKAPNYDFYIDICLNGCGGIYFDNRELNKFDEKHEDIDFIIEALKDKTFIQTDESKQRICPYCLAVMIKNYTDSSHEVQTDSCYTCGATFLDYGELNKIREQFKSEQERSEDFMKNFIEKFNEDMLVNEKEAEKLKNSRSFLRKLFLAAYE